MNETEDIGACRHCGGRDFHVEPCNGGDWVPISTATAAALRRCDCGAVHGVAAKCPRDTPATPAPQPQETP